MQNSCLKNGEADMVRLEVITGPMFSEKTEELIRRLKRFLHGKKKVLIIKPAEDTRAGEKIIARQKIDGKFQPHEELKAVPIESEKKLNELVLKERPDVIGVDEAQFFGEWFVGAVENLITHSAYFETSLERGAGDLTIIIAGLDMDAWRRPFGIMPQLMAMADDVAKQTAVCFNCHGKYGPAVYTQKTGGSKIQVEVGDAEIYEARCRHCHELPDLE